MCFKGRVQFLMLTWQEFLHPETVSPFTLAALHEEVISSTANTQNLCQPLSLIRISFKACTLLLINVTYVEHSHNQPCIHTHCSPLQFRRNSLTYAKISATSREEQLMSPVTDIAWHVKNPTHSSLWLKYSAACHEIKLWWVLKTVSNDSGLTGRRLYLKLTENGLDLGSIKDGRGIQSWKKRVYVQFCHKLCWQPSTCQWCSS